MTAFRTPNRSHPDEMCFECGRWDPAMLDWGDCYFSCTVADGGLRLTYAYGECAFEVGYKAVGHEG